MTTREAGDRACYAGTRVAVLGAAGFVGRWVARRLGECGARVALIVRDAAAAEQIFARYGVVGDIFQADLLEPGTLARILHAVRPAITFNLVAYGVDPAERDATVAHAINGQLVERLCQAVAKVRRPAWPGQDIVHVGSAYEYGAVGGDLSEASAPRPITLYGRSKLAGTTALARCCHAGGLTGVTARLFTVYGPGEHDGRLLPSLLRAARTGQPLELTAGQQKRDFTYVEDVADGLLRLGCAAGRPGEIVNLATGRLTTVRAFAETAAAVLGIPDGSLRFGALPTRAEEMEHAEVTLARLARITGWLPPTNVEAGVRKTTAFLAAGARP